MPLLFRFLTASLVLISMTCSAARGPSPLSPEDPASPSAEEAPVEPLPSLLAEAEPAAPATQPGDDHSQHLPESHRHQEPSKASPDPPTEPVSDVEYVCPMHPHVKQAQAGACPICGMKLEPRRKPTPGKSP